MQAAAVIDGVTTSLALLRSSLVARALQITWALVGSAWRTLRGERDERYRSDLLELLHQRIGDGHAWETLLATMCAWVGVATKTRHQRQIQAEAVDQPLDSRCTVANQHLGQR